MEGGAYLLYNVQAQVEAAEGEEKTERGEPDQEPQNLSAEVERRQAARDGTAADRQQK